MEVREQGGDRQVGQRTCDGPGNGPGNENPLCLGPGSQQHCGQATKQGPAATAHLPTTLTNTASPLVLRCIDRSCEKSAASSTASPCCSALLAGPLLLLLLPLPLCLPSEMAPSLLGLERRPRSVPPESSSSSLPLPKGGIRANGESSVMEWTGCKQCPAGAAAAARSTASAAAAKGDGWSCCCCCCRAAARGGGPVCEDATASAASGPWEAACKLGAEGGETGSGADGPNSEPSCPPYGPSWPAAASLAATAPATPSGTALPALRAQRCATAAAGWRSVRAPLAASSVGPSAGTASPRAWLPWLLLQEAGVWLASSSCGAQKARRRRFAAWGRRGAEARPRPP